MKQSSLFCRLFISVSLGLLVLLIIQGYLVLLRTQQKIDHDYDSQLIADSYTVWTLVREDLEEGDNLGILPLDFKAPDLMPHDRAILRHYAYWRAIRIWKDGKLVTQSSHIRQVPMISLSKGFQTQILGQDKWRVYVVIMPHDKIQIEVWENLQNRQSLMTSIQHGLLESTGIIIPVLILFLIISIRFGMSSISKLALAIKWRKTDNLSPLYIPNLSKELLPIQQALNELLQRVQNSIQREREFLDNVAHQLRTPLTALKLQGELIEKASTEPQRTEYIADLQQGINQAAYLFDQIFLFSRISQQHCDQKIFSPIPYIQEAITQRIQLALKKQIDISMDSDDRSSILSNPELFFILFGSLLDNALKFTLTCGTIHIIVKPHFISITDNGPGIPEAEHELVFKRFSRGKNTAQSGSGLGLSIAKDICDKLGIRIKLRKPKHQGLEIQLLFDS